MKQITTLKKLMLASCLAGAGIANAQYHPLAFGPFPIPSGSSDANWYKDYVGLRFMVNSPTDLAGDKFYTYAFSGTTPWGGSVGATIPNTQIVLPVVGGDTMAAGPILPAGLMTGKIGVVFRGGGIEFVCKAKRVQDAGAIACIIINNQPGGPVGMGSGTMCTATDVTIPVFMMSKEDGDLLAARFRANDTARLTIGVWGQGNTNDLGFVPGGAANWHNYAIPSNQLTSSGNPFEYKMVEGAFIANYGTANQTNVKLSVSTTFTPTGGSAGAAHTNSVTLPTFNASDSIYAMFNSTTSAEYDLAPTGTGRYDVNYNVISPDIADDNMADNNTSNSFYVTDSLYSKGRYDFTNNKPFSTTSLTFGNTDFIWGPMYYVKNGGTSLSRVQYSLSLNSATSVALSGDINIFLFKWTDGSGDQPKDSVLQNGELELKSLGIHTLDGGIRDTSGATLNFSNMGNPDGVKTTVMLEADSWYYLAIGVPAEHFLGSDGIMNPYPRVYGRFKNNNNIFDYQSLVFGTAADISSSPAGNNPIMPSTFTSFINSVDSFNYANTRGIIPSVAMIANNNPPPISVKNTPEVVNNYKVNLFPNPAKDELNVSVSLDKLSKTATYIIVDGLGRFVSKEVHNNVKAENFTINTSKLPAGQYYLVVNSEAHTMASKFVVAK